MIEVSPGSGSRIVALAKWRFSSSFFLGGGGLGFVVLAPPTPGKWKCSSFFVGVGFVVLDPTTPGKVKAHRPPWFYWRQVVVIESKPNMEMEHFTVVHSLFISIYLVGYFASCELCPHFPHRKRPN